MLLENEGGDGSAKYASRNMLKCYQYNANFNSSHWEVRTLGYEIMNAAVQNDESVASIFKVILLYILYLQLCQY